MILYGILTWGNTKFNMGRCNYFVIEANDDDEAYRKFKKEYYPDWIPDTVRKVGASISDEIKDMMRTDSDPIMVETLRSALKAYDEATETDVMMDAINVAKSLLEIKLPGCKALEYLIERKLNGKIMSEVEDALKDEGMLA